MKTYKVIAKRVSYEEVTIKAEDASEALFLASQGEYDWDDLPELEWDIESIEEVKNENA